MLEVAFVDPVVISHRWQKGYVSLRFRAKIKAGNGDRDVVPIVVEHLGANITLWATYAPARKPQTVQKSVYTHSVPVVAAEAVPAFTKKTESVPVSTASPPSEDGKEQSQTKQAKQEMRSFPADLSKVDCAKDGNCVLHAFSKALKHFKDEDRHPRVLRAELVTHMLKHEHYSRTWDKLDPSGNPLTSFEEYCKLIERDGVHLGELEISALAHITHFKVVVVPQGLDFQPTAWNVKEKKLVVLWYSASHIDLALPKGDDAKKYSEDYHKITSGPVCGFRFGGLPSRASAASSCATAWVRVPSCISGASQSSCKRSAKAPKPKGGSGGAISRAAASSCATASPVRVPSAAPESFAPPVRSVAVLRKTASKASCFADEEADPLSDLLGEPATSSADLQAMPKRDGFVEATRARGRPRLVEWCKDGFTRCRLCPWTRPCTDLEKAKHLLGSHFKFHHKGQSASGHQPQCCKLPSLVTDLQNGPAWWRCPLCSLGIKYDDGAKASVSRVRRDQAQTNAQATRGSPGPSGVVCCPNSELPKCARPNTTQELPSICSTSHTSLPGLNPSDGRDLQTRLMAIW